ncbi:MAG: polysaccharide deacetylase family protein [Ruminococcaceae bacterium]|nr:polysaccharide deacetylase family protein [Oscillospiraceae bacterium]
MSMLVKLGKQGKKLVKKLITPAEKHYVGYARRIERVCAGRRVCAMTFDDGPMDLPASPDRFDGRSMTDVLLDTLRDYGAHGTFDVVGDTSENYPDEAGKPGSASWGGIRYDHYPDIGQDAHGGALHCERLIRRMLDEGHQITNHGYRHIIFGKKPFVYGARACLGSLDAAVADLTRLDTLLRERYGYTPTMSRPPHYVDKIGDGFTSYDVCERLSYQYMAASFDGAGWLPSALPDPEAALRAETEAMLAPMRRALEADPDFFCGQIIFQKDGCNMARRTPVAFALGEQLKLLKKYGYEVVTVEALLRESPFADVPPDDPLLPKLRALAETAAVAFTDNRVRLDQPMTNGELAMLLAPKPEAMARREAMIRRAGKSVHPYAGAMAWCAEQGLLPAGSSPDAPITALPSGRFSPTGELSRRGVFTAYQM